MLFTGTDFLIYEIKSVDVYEESFKHKHLSDFSNFSKGSEFYDNQNEVVVGKMKHQHKEISINKSKMHSTLSDDGKESNTAKEVNIATDLMNSKTLYLIKK